MPKTTERVSKNGSAEASVEQTTGKVSKRQRRIRAKNRLRTIPVLPLLNRDVYKRLHNHTTVAGNEIIGKCGDLTQTNAMVKSFEDLEKTSGVVSAIKTTRRRGMRRLLKLIFRLLLSQHDSKRFPLSRKQRLEIEAMGLTYYLETARKIKDGSHHENVKFNEFVMGVADTVPNVSKESAKSLSLITKVVSEDILNSSADLAFKTGRQTISHKQIHCVERLSMGPKSGQKMVCGKYDLSRCPTEQRILSVMKLTI